MKIGAIVAIADLLGSVLDCTIQLKKIIITSALHSGSSGHNTSAAGFGTDVGSSCKNPCLS